MPIIKIKGGKTPESMDSNLCDKCKYNQTIKGFRFNQELRYCNKIHEHVPFVVNECSLFEQHNSPSLWEMQKIGWRVVADRKTKKIGFMSPDAAYKATQKEETHDYVDGDVDLDD